VLPLREGGFITVHGINVVSVLWNWQRCNLFVNSSAGTSVWYKPFPGI
jgi:hypothetical protein